MKTKKIKFPITILLLASLLLSKPGIPVPEISGKTSEISIQSDTEEATPDTRTYPTLDGGTHGMWSPDKELTIVVFIDPYCGIDYNLVKTLRDINFSREKVDICCINDTIYDKEFDRQSMESS